MKNEFLIEKADSYNRLIEYLKTYSGDSNWEGDRYITNDYIFHISPKYRTMLKKNTNTDFDIRKFIYGKDNTEGLVSIDVIGDEVYLFKDDGTYTTRQFKYWMLTDEKIKGSSLLKGDLPLKYIKEYSSYNKFINDRKFAYTLNNSYSIYDKVESAMVKDGYTLFKNIKVSDVSVLSFDIEADGLIDDDGCPISDKPEIYLISNTLLRGNDTIRKLFTLDNYETCRDMILDWQDWVLKEDPSIICGHNIFGYDLPYLNHFGTLRIGRLGIELDIATRKSKKRKDSTQSYEFFDIKCFGRQLIDTMFLAVTYDFGRKYVSYGLKQIIKQEGLEREGRITWDFSKSLPCDIWKNRSSDPEKWEKFKEYCSDDGDDALKLYQLMIPSFFYYAQSIPKDLQSINNSATGSQINSFMVRSYLQDGHSLPIPSKASSYEGAISYGNPGLYSNVLKVDVASLYPSIMIQYKVYDREKDPKGHFLRMVEYFTSERLNNKQLGKETDDRYYKDMEQAQKIVINSAYGMLGATGLLFNSPDNALFVAKQGRDILQTGVKWACGSEFVSVPKLNKNGTPKTTPEGDIKTEWSLTPTGGKGYTIVNVDTDSFSYTKNREVSHSEFKDDIIEINSLYPDKIRWEDDGMYKNVLVVKAKNYILDDGVKLKYKGSSLVDQKKEPALISLLHDLIDGILQRKGDQHLVDIYNNYIIEANNITDINRWATKKTVTEAILTSCRVNETKVKDAITSINGDITYKIGDKIWLYQAVDGLKQEIKKGEPVFYKKTGEPKMVKNTVLRLIDKWDGDYDKTHYMDRVYDTVGILSNVIDINLFINYNLSSSKDLLQSLLGENNG